MTATARDDRLSRSVMFLCLGVSLVLLAIQWQVWASRSIGFAAKQPNQTAPKTAGASARPAATTASTTVKLVLDLSDRRVYIYRDQQVTTSYPVAIGQAGWETPTGSFRVVEMQQNPKWRHPITGEIVPPGPDNPLGKRWIGFWANDRTHLGFHGTNAENLIGQAVSHGCVRMRNRDVIALYDQVTEGTPVIVRP